MKSHKSENGRRHNRNPTRYRPERWEERVTGKPADPQDRRITLPSLLAMVTPASQQKIFTALGAMSPEEYGSAIAAPTHGPGPDCLRDDVLSGWMVNDIIELRPQIVELLEAAAGSEMIADRLSPYRLHSALYRQTRPSEVDTPHTAGTDIWFMQDKGNRMGGRS